MHRTQPRELPTWSRLIEWSIVALILVALVGLYTRQTRDMRGQTELAAVRSTLGALRTALVIDHLRKTVAGVQANKGGARNPFELLQQHPQNYWDASAGRGQAKAPPGHWVFDGACDCVGYVPSDPRWLDHFNDEGIVWFKVTGDGRTGPLELTAKEAYAWQNLSLN